MAIRLDNQGLTLQERAIERRRQNLATQIQLEQQERVQQERSLSKSKEEEKIETETLNESLEIADKLAKAFNKAIKFQIHQETDKIYVEIVDRETGETIKQIPPEEMLKIAASVQEFLGLIVDQHA
ncbi:MAG TPA: flagellar protein FlaG [Firmicutes bacterium]|jgi:flagellar protein FlaG|nr:flagellar protein FlaG [Bacillota bacterium]